MDLLMQGLGLMVIGMTTVFVFLIVLIQAMNLSAALSRKLERFFPEEAPSEARRPAAARDETEEIAVVLAAVRAKRG